MKKTNARLAFTLIELLFVIVVLGIVGGMALQSVSVYYEGIFKAKEYSKRVADADHILDQLVKYFEMGISSSIVNLGIDSTTCYGPPTGTETVDYTVAFIGVDVEGLRGTSGFMPQWSEETSQPNALNVVTVSDANYAGVSTANSVLYDSDSANIGACNRFSWSGTGNAAYHDISTITTNAGATALTLSTDNNATDGHRKYLLSTAYAFRVNDAGQFLMHTNFRPWNGESYTAGTENILGENVAHFYAKYDATDFMDDSNVTDRGLIWQLKVCMKGLDEKLSTEDSTESQAICRERRVYVRY